MRYFLLQTIPLLHNH